MERPSNGGILYHEVQEANLCAVHCVNTVLQGPFFSEFDLAAVASDLDGKERQVMLEGAAAGTFSAGDFFSEESHNVSLGGDFSIQICPICLSNPKDMAFGCGHQTCCDCGPDLQACPICRAPIQTRIKLY
ncbi:hypothetical protein F2Q70_00040856 [Brassica cretica]|uniref:ubiquitinyl hydrolase 1 n=1 Tax=Brassica cretica TaxID=69181 RepID=A0A8S9K1V5_BRACR|nr:hypothetical protein F2Q70_00040856 [Brassica cretica]